MDALSELGVSSMARFCWVHETFGDGASLVYFLWDLLHSVIFDVPYSSCWWSDNRWKGTAFWTLRSHNLHKFWFWLELIRFCICLVHFFGVKLCECFGILVDLKCLYLSCVPSIFFICFFSYTTDNGILSQFKNVFGTF